jgi:SAM-dependent methyltransferase
MNGLMRSDLYAELYQVENTHWWHLHKRKLIHKLIKNFAKKGSVLDIGSGTGKILEELKKQKWDIAGIDAEKEAKIWSEKRGIPTQLVDINKQPLPYKNHYFDLVLCLDLLEHVRQDQKIIDKISKILKPNGTLIVSVPAYPSLFSYWDKMLGHYRRYSKKQLTSLFNQTDWELKFISHAFMLNLLPVILVRQFKKHNKNQSVSDFQTTPLKFISQPLLKLNASFEEFCIPNISLPFGLSIVAVITNKNEESK